MMGKESIGLPDYNWLTEANSVIQADCAAPDRCPTQFPGSLNTAASSRHPPATHYRRARLEAGEEVYKTAEDSLT